MSTNIFLNGQQVSLPSLSRPADLLLQHPHGVYTTAVAVRGEGILDWNLHKTRLLTSIRELHLLGDKEFSTIQEWREVDGPDSDKSLAGVIELFAKQALLASSQDKSHMMLLVLLTNSEHQQDLRRGTAPLDVWIFCSPAPPSHADTPCTVGVMGPPRCMPTIKRASWARDRQPIEARKTSEMAEVLLSDSNGGLLEGLVTNFFVVEEAAETGGGDGPSNLCLRSAPPTAVLPGIMMQRVKEACGILGVRIEWRAPRAAEASSWREAFITNCVRGVQPVGCILCGDADGNGGGGRIELRHQYGPLTKAIQAEVARLQSRGLADAWPGSREADTG